MQFTPTLTQRLDTIDIVKAGRYMFAIAAIAWGGLHFIYSEFIIGRAPAWPDGLPGRVLWAYFSGLVLVAAGIAVFQRSQGRRAMIVVGLMVLAWALIRHIASLIAEPELGGRLTMAGKALTFSGGAFAVAATLPKIQGRISTRLSSFVNPTDNFTLLGRFCLGIFMIICGVQHFLFYPFVQTLVPSWIPGALFWTYFAGVALIAGGLGLMIKKTASLAGILSGGMVLIWFLILHLPRGIEMNSVNEWTSVVESFAVSGLAFVVSGKLLKKG
jgi:uncharacterized membrane protein